MKTYNYLLIVLLLSLFACKSEGEKDVSENTTPKPEVEENTDELPGLSIYNLPTAWTNQNGEEIQLEDLKGDVLVMVMIYTSCKAACPRLVADMRNIHKKVSDEANQNTKYVFVSIDPKTDTPERLKAFAKENEMDSDEYIFLRGTKEDTREFAAVLAVSYKSISPIDFSHSNIISVFDQQGVMQHQKEGLGEDDSKTVKAIEDLAN
ncbi:SCO family protein [Haloflavibacter putidus]|uniref:SCO family protein n=1 Tax=Haloflavibacter putidus TaxID=2576776 RepID=A0A507ZD17_9FLAO|nr:SCO family protein [Haloflavibacter putidus]TQD35410.1 SCO family protein [Haloflavibacter putidus]